jgi:hypothetical protein
VVVDPYAGLSTEVRGRQKAEGFDRMLGRPKLLEHWKETGAGSPRCKRVREAFRAQPAYRRAGQAVIAAAAKDREVGGGAEEGFPEWEPEGISLCRRAIRAVRQSGTDSD